MIVDALQFIRPSRTVFEQMRAANVGAVHMTVSYHEGLRDTLRALAEWNREFEAHGDLIARATTVAEIRAANAAGKTAILFGAQNPLPIEDDLGLIEVWHQTGLRFMQVTYNQQSLLGSGCYEPTDSGLTAFGRNAVAEMNRVGMVIDLSHAGPRTAMEVTAASARPVAITHANPASWHAHPRNVSDELISAVVAKGGMLGFSMYPLHLKGGGACALSDWADMVVACVRRWGHQHFGFGSDLCQGQPDSAVAWMRDGRWKKERLGATFPETPSWFTSNADYPGILTTLSAAGLTDAEVEAVSGGNWMTFMEAGFTRA